MTTMHDSADTPHEAAHAVDRVIAAITPAQIMDGVPTGGPAGLLSHPTIGRRGNGAARVAMIQWLQRTQGNRATRQILQRMASQPADAAPTGSSDLAAPLAHHILPSPADPTGSTKVRMTPQVVARFGLADHNHGSVRTPAQARPNRPPVSCRA
ncbi:MAG: hypothetical protein M3Z04_13975 [Chloroflexota bacterium]|nr:hypothetical protein [Chloroflexota bacterium]